ncbi:MAG: mechanosensitive ion channel family protein, partial [Deltaproteobacteria bacterium]|nr:mechanosensitive ion channel family protein [Deltaproteobacteria bacterium]
MAFDTVRNLLGQYPFMAQMLMAVGVLILSFVSYFMTKHYLLKAVSKLIQRTKTKFDDILMQRDVLRRLSYVAPIIVIYIFAHLF